MHTFCLPRPPRLAALAWLLLAAGPALAGPVVSGTSGFGYHGFPGTLNENGTPFFDQHSNDGNNLNVGNYLTKTGGFASSFDGKDSPGLAPGNLEYWGKTGFGPHKADPNFHFNSTATVTATLYLTMAGNWAQNTLGWYSVADKNTLHQLFTGDAFGASSTYPLSVLFNPNGDFGLYMKDAAGNIYYTDTSLNPAGDNFLGIWHQHFTAFRQTDTGKLWVGAEDTFGPDLTEFVGDYNDFIFTLDDSVAQAPEPSTMVLAGIGVMGLAGARLRRRKA